MSVGKGGCSSAVSGQLEMGSSIECTISHTSVVPPATRQPLGHQKNNATPQTNGGPGLHLPQLRDEKMTAKDRCGKTESMETSIVRTMLESLRWEQELSDEEAEEARLEIYKANRRKRYQEALQQHRTRWTARTKTAKTSSTHS